ncbi:MAG: ABC transporter permease [Thermoflavifilum sp.]|nr:ABC transporter permease [Thermoflavifilum sp.]
MRATWLILKKEYLTRVRKKSFIIITIVAPLLFMGFIALEIFIIGGGAQQKLHIAVLDNSHLLDTVWKDREQFRFTVLHHPLDHDSLLAYAAEHGYNGLLYIPDTLNVEHPGGIQYYSQKKLSLDNYVALKNIIEESLQHIRFNQLHLNVALIDSVRKNIQVNIDQPITQASELQAGVAIAISMICGILIYFVLIFFGVAVMRGVMEEKMNRIAEVIVSSVKPFQLMLGKILGIATVGLTQFFIWLILLLILWSGLHQLIPSMDTASQVMTPSTMPANESMQLTQSVLAELTQMPILEIIVFFIVYFLGGYFLYASLFAAVGSVVDQEATDAQQLTLPITLPIIISFLIAIQAARNPDSPLAVFTSIFPLSSPLVMVARLPYGVPWWQLGLSLILLIASFLFTTWLAGRIYRTGILLYGKKVTLREMMRWAFRSR